MEGRWAFASERKARRPSTGLPDGTFPTPGSLTPCGVRSPGATSPSSLRDFDLATQTKFRDTYKDQGLATALRKKTSNEKGKTRNFAFQGWSAEAPESYFPAIHEKPAFSVLMQILDLKGST